jgi:hypothetical protein
MRTHGFPSFPDPESNGGGFEDGEIQAQGIDVNSAQYQSAYNTSGQPALKAARMSPTDALWSL